MYEDQVCRNENISNDRGKVDGKHADGAMMTRCMGIRKVGAQMWVATEDTRFVYCLSRKKIE